MLVGSPELIVRAAFEEGGEIGDVVQVSADQLLGSRIIYLPRARSTTVRVKGTVPGAVVIDVEVGRRYLVEAERAVHGTWEHIIPCTSIEARRCCSLRAARA